MAVYNVSNTAEFQAAISAAVGGDKIVLADGNYGGIWIQNKRPTTAITIQAANPGTSVHFDALTVHSSANLSFSGIDIGRALASNEPEWTQITTVRESSNIKFNAMKFHGSLDGDPSNDGLLLGVTAVSGFTVTNSTFTEGFRGVVANVSNNITVKDNNFTLLRSDGVISTGNDGIMIDGNRFTEFRPILGDHADAIQFFNIGQTKGQTNITIKNNVLIQTYFSGIESTGVQGIWITDAESYPYKNVLIENNLLYSNDLYNGLSVMGATDVQIIGNTVLSDPTDGKMFWIRLDGVTGLSLQNNVADNILSSNMTQFFQNGNVNLTADPSLRAALANLLNPADVHDLLLPNIGYQLPTSMPAAPVSAAAGSGITDMLSLTRGSALGSTVVVDEKDTSSTGPADPLASSMILSFVPSEEPAVPATHWAAGERFHLPRLLFDHYVALP